MAQHQLKAFVFSGGGTHHGTADRIGQAKASKSEAITAAGHHPLGLPPGRHLWQQNRLLPYGCGPSPVGPAPKAAANDQMAVDPSNLIRMHNGIGNLKA